MRNRHLLLGMALALSLVPAGLAAQCTMTGQMTRIRLGSIIRNVCAGVSGDCGFGTNAAIDQMIDGNAQWWGRVMNRGRMEPGPRAIRPRNTVDQRLNSQLEQTWILSRAIDGNVTVRFKKRRGLGGAYLRCCAIGTDLDGRRLIQEIDVDDGRANHGEEYSLTFPLNREAIIVKVIAWGQSPTNLIDYELWVGR